MAFTFTVHRNTALPRLGWVATVSLSRQSVEAHVGPDVEAGAHFLVEGVWDGAFSDGRFDRSAVFFGSGLIVDGEGVRVVPSRAPIDRVVWCRRGGDLLVANSVLMLLAFTGARLDPQHDYVEESITIGRGLDRYQRSFRVLHGEIAEFRQHYFENLVLREGDLVEVRAPLPAAPTSLFDYRTRLDAYLVALAANWNDPARRTRMKPWATMSRGYDSPAVCALVRKVGVDTVFTSKRSNSFIPKWYAEDVVDDDGTPIAELLGLAVRELVPPGPALAEDDELLFLSGNRTDPEVVFASMARDIADSGQVGVVFTGYLGDLLWSLSAPPEYCDGRLTRSDSAGLGMSEARVYRGFIHVPLPMIFGTHIEAMVKISNTPELAPWRLGTSYDRPIPRQILEEAGVPRHLFGQKKKAVTRRYDLPRSQKLRERFFREHGLSATLAHTYSKGDEAIYRARRALVYLEVRGDRSKALKKHTDSRLLSPIDFRRETYLLSVKVLSERLVRVFSDAARQLSSSPTRA